MSRAISVTVKVPFTVRTLNGSQWKQAYRQRWFSQNCSQPNKSKRTPLCDQLEAKIKISGPLTVSQYMKEALLNPISGYYTQQEVFGEKGDFITSPEISQMFGELVGIWCVSEWLANGSPTHLNVVELGPGRGTLADDVLRVFSQFEGIKDAVHLRLVEVSPRLSEVQREKLCGDNEAVRYAEEDEEEDGCYMTCTSKYGGQVSWYHTLQKVPRGIAFYVAHEFFDALPIHKFQKKDGHWHEVLIDVDSSAEAPHYFRYVLSQQHTTASALLLKAHKQDPRDHLELCPEAGVIVQDIADRIAVDGGFSLIADYGHTGEKTDTFRGFKDHKLHEPLAEPGMADLTADVDFTYLKSLIQDKVLTFGPINQQSFLLNMGIGARMRVLMGKGDATQRKNILSALDMLTNLDKMGERFKFLGLIQKRQDLEPGYTPAGFKALS